MTFFDAVLLGIVEGLTEFLPISSTGHMILAEHFLKIQETTETKAFDVIIQSGAILAVVWYYREELWSLCRRALQTDRSAVREILSIFIAFLPAAVIGLLFRKWITEYLFGFGPVIGAMLVGGVVMIALERWLKSKNNNPPNNIDNLEQELHPKQAVSIGFFQCLAMWPGTSRSMVTILGARLVGLNAMQAAHFSFLLAIPTLFGATLYEGFKQRHEIFGGSAGNMHSLMILGVGTAVSFVVALFVIKAFLGYLKKHSLEAFGWYRIVLGCLLWFLI